MSVEIVKTQISRFITQNDAGVLAVKGKWGTGKTYAWHRILAEINKELKPTDYAYISLFGMQNIETVKFSIFENHRKIGLINKPTCPAVKLFNWLWEKTKKYSNYGKETPWTRDFMPAIGTLAFARVKNYIICIDDVERKGANLEIAEVMGLVNLLKEEKNAK